MSTSIACPPGSTGTARFFRQKIDRCGGGLIIAIVQWIGRRATGSSHNACTQLLRHLDPSSSHFGCYHVQCLIMTLFFRTAIVDSLPVMNLYHYSDIDDSCTHKPGNKNIPEARHPHRIYYAYPPTQPCTRKSFTALSQFPTSAKSCNM